MFNVVVFKGNCMHLKTKKMFLIIWNGAPILSYQIYVLKTDIASIYEK